MPYTVETLANNALYLSGVVARNFQTPTEDQTNLAIDNLNSILSDKTVDKGMIPYYSELDWTSIPGQMDYYFPNLIEIETCVFYINSVRYAMTQINRKSYFGDPRAENIQSLPFNYHFERQLGGAKLFLYFAPVQAYPMKIWGLWRMQQVTINQDLEQTLDRFYIDYLEYKTAERVCFSYNYEVPPGVDKQLTAYNNWIDKSSAKMDITMNKISALSQYNRGVNYGLVNLGPWSPT